MWQLRYWAVLGFEALLGITIVTALLSLLLAANVQGALVALVDPRPRLRAVLVADPPDGASADA